MAEQGAGRMQLTLGPVLYNWQPERWRDFYFRMADEAPLDRVVVGEVVCSKRAPFFEPYLPEVIERLMAAGKQVLLGSLVLASLRRERRQTASLAEFGHGLVEVNDLTCLKSIAGRPHAIGPFVNIYNEASAAFHAAQGATRICLPPELPLSSVAAIAGAVPQVAIEVFAFGRVPLAISARCYHARLHKLAKDNCRFVCEQDPDGLVVTTLDNEAFLTMNGVQTLSHGCCNLLGDLDRLTQSGVRSLRLSPQACDMVAVSEQFQAVLAGRVEAGAARDRLREIYPDVPFANGFLHGAPGASYVSG